MLVVSDTSVLLYLVLVRQDHLLSVLFDTVVVPSKVEEEFLRLAATPGRFYGLPFPKNCDIVHCQEILSELVVNTKLDAGETEALSLAVSLRAEAVLMDEAAGRQVANEMGILPIGVLGILVRAKRAKALPEVAPVLRELLTAGKFRASADLVEFTLKLAGELPSTV